MKARLPKTPVAAAVLVALLAPPPAAPAGSAFSLATPAQPTPGLPGGAAFSLAARVAEAQAPAAAPSAEPAAMPKKTRRALLELGALAAYSTYRYWADYHRWIEDWQYELTCEDQYRRFLTTEAVRFDSNNYVTNWTHALAGALYYQFGRTNYLTWEESFLCAFGSSLLYEYVSEWREVISINDMFLTTFGAVPLGEGWFQVGDYLHHRKSPVLRALGFLNPINELNHWFDRGRPASKAYRDPGWHAFSLSAGGRRVSETGRAPAWAGYLAFEAEIVRVPEYGRPGAFRRVIGDAPATEIALEVALRSRRPEDDHLRGGSIEDVDLYARTVGRAWYRQSIDELGRGEALSIGLGTALTYVRKRPTVYDLTTVQVRIDPLPETPTDFRDKMTVTHLVGPVVDWTKFGRRSRFRLVADAYVDFAMMAACAFNAWSAVRPIDGMKTTMSYFGYYYAYGASASVRADLERGPFWLRGLVSAHLWDSWDGRDRFEDELAADVDSRDTRTRFLLKGGWRIPGLAARLFAAVDGVRRWGRIGEITAATRETRVYAGMSYIF